jgi:hypothetical protein
MLPENDPGWFRGNFFPLGTVFNDQRETMILAKGATLPQPGTIPLGVSYKKLKSNAPRIAGGQLELLKFPSIPVA